MTERDPDVMLEITVHSGPKVLVWSDGKRPVQEVVDLLRLLADGFESGELEQVE